MTGLPDHLVRMPSADFTELLDFANDVSAWALEFDASAVSFGMAAEHFAVPVQRISDAVEAHYWMFTHDTDRPMAERTIDHDGE